MKRSYCYTFNYGITIEQRENLICTDKIFIPVLQKKKKKMLLLITSKIASTQLVDRPHSIIFS
jgi:hypothetical protein